MTTLTSSTTTTHGERPWAKPLKAFLSYGVLILLAIMFIYPFLLAIGTSFKTMPEIAANPSRLIPETFTLEGYQRLFTFDIGRWTFNSAFVAVSITLGNLLFASLAGYALARIPFPGSRLAFLGILGTMMIPGIVLIIPMFIVLKSLGMINTYQGLIIPKLTAAFGIFLMKQFFESVPKELEEAARMDGANAFQTFFRVVLPTARPAMVALIIFSFQGAWNDFMHPLIVVTTAKQLWTLPLGLALLRGGMGQNLLWNSLLAGSMLTTLPMAIIFFVFQRYFIEGISYSGIKG